MKNYGQLNQDKGPKKIISEIHLFGGGGGGGGGVYSQTFCWSSVVIWVPEVAFTAKYHKKIIDKDMFVYRDLICMRDASNKT